MFLSVPNGFSSCQQSLVVIARMHAVESAICCLAALQEEAM